MSSVVAAGTASLLTTHSAAIADETSAPQPIVDTNLNLFRWPFRRLPLDESPKLVAKLRALGVVEAWAGSFEGLLQRDLASVNRRLFEECNRYRELVPIGSINVELPGWRDDLQQCIEQYNMPGIRLHPNYHGYTLSDRRFGQLLEQATSAGRFVQIAAAMEDTRTQHPLVRAADVDLQPLGPCLRDQRDAKVQILNYRPRAGLLEDFADIPGIYFDTARVEGTDGVARLIRGLPTGRVLFGSHAPFLIPEAALIRVHESDLTGAELGSLLSAGAKAVRT